MSDDTKLYVVSTAELRWVNAQYTAQVQTISEAVAQVMAGTVKPDVIVDEQGETMTDERRVVRITVQETIRQ